MRATLLTALLGAGLFLTAPAQVAAAQGVFRQPGKIALDATDVDFIGTRYFGRDKDGYDYYDRGGIACHHVGDALDVEYGIGDVNFFDGNGTRVGWRLHAQLTADGSGVDVAYFPLYPYWQTTNIEPVRFYRVSCAALAANGPAAAVQLGGTILQSDDPLLVRVGSSPEFVRVDADTFCIPTTARLDADTAVDANGVICIDTGTTPAAITQLVDSAELDEALDVDPGFAAAAYLGNGEPVYSESWSLSGVTMAPGARLFFIADRVYFPYPFVTTPSPSYSERYIVERTSDGELHARFGPIRIEQGGFTVVSGMGRLAYSAELDAVVAWPVLNQEHNSADWELGGHGWTGIGFRVIPLDAPGTGYLSLSRQFIPRVQCTEALPSYCGRISNTTMLATEAGLYVTVLLNTLGPTAYRQDVYRVQVNKDLLDLDDDGLNAAEEAALGTWDTVPDSDFRGTPDGIEARVAHTDPRDPNDEPAGRVAGLGRIRYVPSDLIALRLPARGSNETAPRSAGAHGPYCYGGLCYGPEGVVAAWPVGREVPGTYPVVSADGTFIMLETAAGLERFYFDDGREELAVPRAALDGYVPTGPRGLVFVPVDAERTWLLSDGADVNGLHEPALVALADGDEVTVLYDHAQAQRDSGLPVATDDFFDASAVKVGASIRPIGWDAETEQLHIGVIGTWDTYLIGVGVDGSVTLLSNGRARAGMNELDWYHRSPSPLPPYLPTFMVPTGHGDYLTTGGVMTPFGDFVVTDLGAQTDLRFAPVSFWGDVILDGGSELVRYDGSVSPGDLLLVAPGLHNRGMMLSKSGPRGGLASLWPAENEDILDAAGVDLARDGSMRLCVADAVANELWELEPAGTGGPPELLRYAADVPGILDCAYDDDGVLTVLAAGPARLLTRDGDFGDLALSETLSGPAPIELLRRPDGELEVRRRGDGLRGKIYLSDGREVSMRESDLVLRVDGVAVMDFPRLMWINDLSNLNPDHEARVALAERPDGLLVLAPQHAAQSASGFATLGAALIVDPVTRKAVELAGVDTRYSVSMLVVPGGLDADPWTGRLNGAGGGPIVAPPGVTPPIVPEAPSGGEPVAAADEGCAGGGAGSPPWLAFALGFPWFAARLRRVWRRLSSTRAGSWEPVGHQGRSDRGPSLS